MWLSSGAAVVVDSNVSLVLLSMREVFVGLILGGVAALIFYGVEYAGELAGMQMGFAIAGILDPQTGHQVSIVSKFQGALAILLFLAVNGHYFVLKALLDSLAVLPVGSMAVNLGASMSFVTLAGKVFVIALQIAAPATILLLLVNVGLGVIARMVPQMNVFIVGFPLMITVGVFMFYVSMPAFVALTRNLVENMYADFVVVLKAF
jgi:flagellar biosynthetic protein FliR